MDIRNELAKKQRKTKLLTRYPTDDEGGEPDMVISRTSDGLFLCVKYKNKWYKTELTKVGG